LNQDSSGVAPARPHLLDFLFFFFRFAASAWPRAFGDPPMRSVQQSVGVGWPPRTRTRGSSAFAMLRPVLHSRVRPRSGSRLPTARGARWALAPGALARIAPAMQPVRGSRKLAGMVMFIEGHMAKWATRRPSGLDVAHKSPMRTDDVLLKFTRCRQQSSRGTF